MVWRRRPSRSAIAKGLAFRVLHREDIQREAVGGGEGLGVDDRAARHGDGAGELREQARMVGGVEHDLGHGAEVVGARVQARAARLRASALAISAGMAFLLVGCRRPASNCRNGGDSARSRSSPA